MDIDFKKYCEINGVLPLKQTSNKFLSPSLKKRIVLATSPSKSVLDLDYSLIDSYSHKKEFCPGGGTKLLKELKKVKKCATQDLHGLNKTEAILTLERFILRNLGKIVKIIHGKGINSPNGCPELKGLVRRYLEHSNLVLAFSEGSYLQGGSGVTIVRLKNSRS